MSRASEGKLADLHGALAFYFADRLRNSECTASDLNVIRQFLKDNGINCVGENNETLAGIALDLPKFDDEDTD